MSSQQIPVMFSIQDASKAWHGIPALIDAHLDLYSGEVHGLVGENGAGKSTLIKLIAGVVAPDSLQVRLNGQTVHIHNPASAYRAGLRFIHQELNIVPSLSVAENIFTSHPYPRRAGLFVDWKRLYQMAGDVLAQLGIHHIDTRQHASQLRPGDAMLVKIASTFIGQSFERDSAAGRLIYVMDEPTAALTSAEAELLFAVIDTLKQLGCAVLYVTHRLDELERIAQRVTVMRDGRVIAAHDMRSVTPDQLIQEMTGRSMTSIFPPRDGVPGAEIRLEARDVSTARITAASLTVQAGEIVGIAGLNGSGRSELLRALIGADALESGTVLLDGQEISDLNPALAWERGIAYVPEERRSQGLVLAESISANMTLPHLHTFSTLATFVRRQHEQQISLALADSVRLKATSTRQHVRELSGGNQQKTLFGRAMARQPLLLLLDEPTRGVDVGAKFDIYRIIRDLAAQGVSILMVSSELGELIGMCDRILIMRDRRLVGETMPAGLTEEGLLSLCYGFGKEG